MPEIGLSILHSSLSILRSRLLRRTGAPAQSQIRPASVDRSADRTADKSESNNRTNLNPEGNRASTMIGKTLSHYKITEQLGKGGMGEVYLVKDGKLGGEAEMKIIRGRSFIILICGKNEFHAIFEWKNHAIAWYKHAL